MKTGRARGALTFAALTALCATVPAPPALGAEAWPSRPIRFVVAFAAGGPTDTVARIVGQKLTQRLGVTVVVDNRPGATGTIGADVVAKSQPDGHTLLLCTTSPQHQSTMLMTKTPYDGMRDIAPVTIVLSVPYLLLVNPAGGYATVGDLVAAAKARPGTLNYGSSGTGSTSHVAGLLFGQAAGIAISHVPYKGSAPAAIDLIGGQLQFIMEAVAAGIAHVRSGRLRALGISQLRRFAGLPDVPTIAEAGIPGFEASVYHGVCIQGATPAALVARINREIVTAIAEPDTRERLVGIGAELVGSSPEAFRKAIVESIPRTEKLIRDFGLR